MNPRVSVVMPLFNGEKYLRLAVDSILSQTLANLEFIIIDDGSSDRSPEIIQSYQDQRIRFSRNEQNIGVTRTLNKGLKQAIGEYIARMDCDDVSLPDRLAKQVAFMDSNPDVGACGTWALDIDQTGKVIAKRETPVGERLDNFYWQSTPIIHSSAMFRFTQLSGPWYDQASRVAQDYDLWLRIRAAQKLGNIAEHLLLYRVHDASITAENAERQTRASYVAFCKHAAGDKISYDEFTALLSYTNELDPLRRALAMKRLAKRLGKPYLVFLGDDVRYARRWLYSRRLYRLAFGPQGFRAFCKSMMRAGFQRKQT